VTGACGGEGQKNRKKCGPCLWKAPKHRVAIWPFLKIHKNGLLKGLFWTNLSKFETFYEIKNIYLVILTNFLKKIWLLFGLFSFFRIWPF